jgi:hypothetical protein
VQISRYRPPYARRRLLSRCIHRGSRTARWIWIRAIRKARLSSKSARAISSGRSAFACFVMARCGCFAGARGRHDSYYESAGRFDKAGCWTARVVALAVICKRASASSSSAARVARYAFACIELWQLSALYAGLLETTSSPFEKVAEKSAPSLATVLCPI